LCVGEADAVAEVEFQVASLLESLFQEALDALLGFGALDQREERLLGFDKVCSLASPSLAFRPTILYNNTNRSV
jgi:hypothetical protein